MNHPSWCVVAHSTAEDVFELSALSRDRGGSSLFLTWHDCVSSQVTEADSWLRIATQGCEVELLEQRESCPEDWGCWLGAGCVLGRWDSSEAAEAWAFSAAIHSCLCLQSFIIVFAQLPCIPQILLSFGENSTHGMSFKWSHWWGC